MIQPVGFIVATKAEKYHGISHERALLIGKPLRDVLQELLVDMRICSEAGGRIAVHHLEFDCGIIAMELKRARLEQHCVEWANFAAKGICTLSPAIGKWVCQCVGRDTGPENKMNTLRLSDLVDTLLPGHPLKRHMRTAGADAQMHRLLVIAMQKLLKQQPIRISSYWSNTLLLLHLSPTKARSRASHTKLGNRMLRLATRMSHFHVVRTNVTST